MAMRLNENLDDNGEMHEINVTPFIDVMLVLLIIFMVAAPLATVDVKVNLPASTSTPQPRPEKPVYLSVKADNTMFIGNDPVTDDTMIAERHCCKVSDEAAFCLIQRPYISKTLLT
ncbi:biopolymer transporter ExbD, partial [Salmonella enterica]|uniref:biopolymer transporter ExbD n=1 Tax=Salmonella enterica TaxID=28901 RepID=UPI00398C33C2